MRKLRFILAISLLFAVWQMSSSFAWAGWIIETLDSEGIVGSYTSIALDSSDYPHISYWDESNDDLKYARWDGSSWEIETVDSEGDVGSYTSIALDSSNYPHISYWDGAWNYDLKYARQDIVPPGEVTSFTASQGTFNGEIDLSWTNPTDADFAGTLILRKAEASISESPVDGTSYSVGDRIGEATVAYTTPVTLPLLIQAWMRIPLTITKPSPMMRFLTTQADRPLILLP